MKEYRPKCDCCVFACILTNETHRLYMESEILTEELTVDRPDLRS